MLITGYQIRLVFLMQMVSSVFGRLEFNDWHCGSSDFTRRMSFESIGENCEEIMRNQAADHETFPVPVNHCCVVHDDCYTLQHGQEKCDEEFCECNRRASIARNDCRDLLEASCSLVQLFGFSAYHNSANYSEPTDFFKHKLHVENLATQYDSIYMHCPSVNATTSSCALQYNLCENTPVECAERLCRCINDATTVDENSSCHEVVDATCTTVISDAKSWRNVLRNTQFLRSNMLKVTMGACMVMLLFCILQIRPSNSAIVEKGHKYFPV
ncbi:hypothetical protein NECAME_09840 [Necator americanus]|uniref:Phospholipase A2 n=1 Tax=Necator americanus TaxID=51031 RepID=W2TEI0_NECAM|nr:hypothetical protein NECAME_09840 [Necator americanus]ETN79402.1 hypothetical protein NECAME_09840 [Necator americanus]